MPRFNESLYKFHSLHEHSHRDALKGAEWPDTGERIGDKLVFIVCLIALVSFIIGWD